MSKYGIINDPWLEGGGGGGGGSDVNVVNNLITNSATDALSAAQGVELKRIIDENSLKVASTTGLGQVRIDGTSIIIDSNGVISTNLDFEGNLRKEELVIENFTGGENSITFTPQVVASPFVELVYNNTTKLNPNHYTLVDNNNGSYTVNFTEPLKDTDLINITLLSGLANGEKGTPLSKESFRFESLATAVQQGVTIPFNPTKVKDTFIELVYVNTTKLEESEYQIVKNSDNPLSYDLIIGNTVNINPSTMVNLVLIDGRGFGGGTGGGAELYYTVDDTNDKAVTPLAVKNYVESLESTLADDQRQVFIAQGLDVVPIDNPNYNPDDYVLLLFNNTVKLFNNMYSIRPSTTTASGYEIKLNNVVTANSGANFEVVLIYGKALANNIQGGIATINGNVPDNNGNIEVEVVDKYIYSGNTAPADTSLFWVRE